MFDSVRVPMVRAWIVALAVPSPELRDDERIDLIRVLEDLKSAASAAQARVSVAFDASQRAAQRAAGVPAELVGRGVAAQVALARRESPSRGGRLLGLARTLVTEMPHTLAALERGVLSEWRATLLARESACLSVEDRAALDRQVARDPAELAGLGDRALVARARAVAQRLDVASVVARARRAENERCVTIRPTPDTMTYLTALLPVAQGVAVYGALVRAADAARATGDSRSRGHVMADELVRRIAAGRTGEVPGAAGTTGGVAPGSPGADTSSPIAEAGSCAPTPDRRPVRLEVQLVMADRTLLSDDDEPAHLSGYGTVPGPWARRLVLAALDGDTDQTRPTGPHGSTKGSRVPAPGDTARDAGFAGRSPGPLGRAQVWVRRLFTAPTTGQLVAMDSRARLAPDGLADLIRARDGTCRTPWCDAPIRHIDHVVPAVGDGPTEANNLQGLCEACNHAKQATGWQEIPVPGGNTSGLPPDVVMTTPTGHRYVSRAPTLPGAA